MYAVTPRFVETLTGSHQVVSRATLITVRQFGVTPVGLDLPILGGDVKLASTSDVKATLSLTVPGDYWELVQPYGAEIFVERGVAFGDGSTELVPLGYFRIEDVEQPSAPYGPVEIDGADRISQMQDNRVLYPYQVPTGATHRAVFERLVNGRKTPTSAVSTEGYGMFVGTAVPITWTGYNPDTATVPAGQVVEDSSYKFLAGLADERGCVLRFGEDGGLYIEARDRDPDAAPVYAVRPGTLGNLVTASRRTTREGVYNIVTAYGSDPAAPTGYQLAYNNDVNSPLLWSGLFGAVVRYFASPVLRDSAGALAAAKTVLSRSVGLPSTVSVLTVPNPALRPLDAISVQTGDDVVTHLIDEVEIPLAGASAVKIKTRTRNPVGVVQEQPNPTPTPAPDPTGPDPGPPGGADPTDGTQAAVLLGWGPVIDGDEFQVDYASGLGPKWSVYNSIGHSGNGLRRPSAYSVSGGIMTCYGDNVSGGTTGGAAFKRDEKYMRFEWRMRTFSVNPSAPGNRYHPVLLTWPTNNQWPQGGELDYFECNCDTGKLGWFIHYPNHQPKRQEGGERPLDIQNWHNYALEWSSRGIKAWVDGNQYFSYTQSNIQPPGPMHLTTQLDNFFGSNMCPAKMEHKWLRIYANPG